jgi:hypothetical protein
MYINLLYQQHLHLVHHSHPNQMLPLFAAFLSVQEEYHQVETYPEYYYPLSTDARLRIPELIHPVDYLHTLKMSALFYFNSFGKISIRRRNY